MIITEKTINWNHITVYKLLILDWYTWNHSPKCKLFVLDKNTWYCVTVFKQMIIDKTKCYLKNPMEHRKYINDCNKTFWMDPISALYYP